MATAERRGDDCERFVGDDDVDIVRGKPASIRFEDRRIDRSTSRAWRPKDLTFDAMSLLHELAVDEETEGDILFNGPWALRAARTWAGVTETFGEASLEIPAEAAASIAPRRTSKRLRTSPVKAATFFVNNTNGAAGSNFLASSADSALYKGASRPLNNQLKLRRCIRREVKCLYR